MPEKRAFRPRIRKSGVRDSRWIIIATEGKNTEKYYFENLAAAYFNPRIHVEVLERIETGSDPQRVLSQLDNFRREYKIKQNYDELWLVIDVDRWGSAKLADVARSALKKNLELAVSNPCFELWLLLHHRDLGEYSPEILHELHLNRKEGTNRTRIGRELLTILGKYNKENLATDDFIPHVQKAIERGQALDTKPEDRWPNDLGSRVYRLAMKIVQK